MFMMHNFIIKSVMHKYDLPTNFYFFIMAFLSGDLRRPLLMYESAGSKLTNGKYQASICTYCTYNII